MSLEQKQLADELHRQARRNYPRRRTICLHRDDLWQCDLIEMANAFPPRLNKGYRYVLMTQDCFTRYAFARPLLNKSGPVVTEAFRDILRENGGRGPKHLQSDDGTEFYNVHFKKMLNEFGINHYSTKSIKKAALVERLNRTIKGKMWKRQTIMNTEVWIDMLQDVIATYNKSNHRTIGMSPKEARKPSNAKHIRLRLAVSKTPIAEPKFRIGDRVRVSKIKGIFEKSYIGNWSEEVFVIHALKNTVPRTYVLKDELGEIIEGSFYEFELQRTKLENYFRIEKVLRRRMRGGHEEMLVKWKGYDDRFNSWVKTEESIKL